MSRFAQMVQGHLGAAERKQASLDQAEQEKRDYLDPEFRFNVADARIVDADTVELPSGERLRLSGGEGRALDSYETRPDVYEQRPAKEAAHKRAYAEAFGLDPDDVTREDLIIAGESQKAKFKERLLGAAGEDGTISYRNRGMGDDDRTIAELDNDQVNLSGRGENAGYEAPWNWKQRLEDAAAGKTAEHLEGTGDRGLATGTKDQVSNFVGGGLRMLNDLAQGAGTLAGANNIPGVDQFFHDNRDRLEAFKEKFTSPQQQRRERLEGERNELQSEFFNVQRDKYLADGNSEVSANVRAGIDEFANSVGNIIDNPGAILDKTIESLPYMLGVAGIGRAATKAAIKGVQKKVLQRTGVQKNISKGLEKTKGRPGTKGKFQSAEDLEATAAWHTNQFISSKAGEAYLKRVATSTGITAVGLSEGLSTSAEVYDSVRFMTEEQALNSEKYVSLREKGLTHDQATEELAEEAHLQTFMSVSLAAGLASAGTGAGAFEGQLFTKLAGIPKTAAKVAKEAAKQETKKGAIRTVAGAAAKATGKAAKFAGPSAVKEGAEELLQSGGGEFLSQLAKFDATGEQVGPGVGRAAGEGAVVGFASGAGAQTVFGGIAKLGSLDPTAALKKAQAHRKSKQAQPTSAVKESVRPTKPATQEKVLNNEAPNVAPENLEDPLQTFTATYDKHANKEDFNALEALDELSSIRARAYEQGKPLSEQQEQQLATIKVLAEPQVAAVVDDIRSKEELDENDLAILEQFADRGFKIDTEGMPEAAARAVKNAAKLAEDFEKLETIQDEAVEAAKETSKDGGQSVRETYRKKFGDYRDSKDADGVGKHGLAYYRRRMNEIMSVIQPGSQNSELTNLVKGLANFKKSQINKRQWAEAALARKADVGTVKYVSPEANKALVDILNREEKQFNAVVKGLRDRYGDFLEAGKTTITNAAGPSPKAQKAAEARERTNAANRQTKAETPVDKRLNAELDNILKNTEAGSRARADAFRKFAKKAGKSKDAALKQRFATASNANVRAQKKFKKKKNAEKKEARQAKKVEAAQQVTEGKPIIVQSREDGDGNKRTFELVADKDGKVTNDAGNQARVREIGTEGKPRLIPVSNLDEDSAAIVGEIQLAGSDAQFARDFSSQFTTSISGIIDETSPEPAPATQAAPAVRRTVRDAAKEGVQSVLSYLTETSRDEAFVALVKRVQSSLGTKDTTVTDLTAAEFVAEFPTATKRTNGAYLNGKVYINTSAMKSGKHYANTVLHESLHFALDGQTFPKELEEEWRNLNNRIVLALAREDDPDSQLMASILQRDHHELLTHGIGTPWFQDFLKNLDLGTEQTGWSKFVEFVAQLLGLENTNALARVLDITDQLLTEVAPEAQNEGVNAPRADTTEPGAEAEGAAQAEPQQRTEAVAPTTPLSEEALREQAQARETALRLSQARRFRTLAKADKLTGTVTLRNADDQVFLDNLLEEGLPMLLALEQLVSRISPNPAAVAKVEPIVSEMYRGQASVQGAQLNDKLNKKGVPARPLFEYLADLGSMFSGVVTNIESRLAKVRMGSKLSAMYGLRKQTVKDLLASSEQIMEILADPASRDEFVEKVGATPAEEEALRALGGFYKVFDAKFHEEIKRLDSPNELIKQLETGPYYYFTGTEGKFDSNFVGAMALEAMQWLTTTGSQTTWNSDDDIRAILGLPDFAEITADMRAVVGRGTLRNQVAQEIGNKVLQHMNLKVKGDTAQRPYLNQTMASAIGSQVLMTLSQITKNVEGEALPLVTMDAVERDVWNQIATSDSSETSNKESVINLVSNTSWKTRKTNPNGTYAVDSNGMVIEEYHDASELMRERVAEGREIFRRLFGSTTNVRTPMLSKPQQRDIPTKVARSVSDIPQEMQNRMLKDAQKGFYAKTGLMDIVGKFSSLQSYLRAGHKFKSEEELQRMHTKVRRNEEGRNDGLLRDLQEAVEWTKRHKDGLFYLPSKMIRSGRVYLNSNIINPQQSKLHRFLFGRENWARTIVKKDFSAMNDGERVQYTQMMVAIGLAMGIKTDRKGLDLIVQEVEQTLATDEAQAALAALSTEADTFTAAEEQAVAAMMAAEGTHTLAGLVAYNDWKNTPASQKVSIDLPNETDGITNGYIIGLMATPPAGITDAYKDLLRAGGVFFEGDPWDNFADYMSESGNMDNYQHIAQDTGQNIDNQIRIANATDPNKMTDNNEQRLKARRRKVYQQRLTDVIAGSGLVPSRRSLLEVLSDKAQEGRKWAKNPLMVVSYGAGLASTVRSMVNAATEKFYEKLAEANNGVYEGLVEENSVEHAEQVATAMNRAFGIIAMTSDTYKKTRSNIRVLDEEGQPQYIAPNFRKQTAADIIAYANRNHGASITEMAKNFELTNNAARLFHEGIANTYGEALTTALTGRLSDVLAARSRMNSANKVANMAYVVEYENRVAKFPEFYGRPALPADKLDIRKGMQRQGILPVIPTAESTGLEDALEMTNYENEYLPGKGVGYFQNKRQLTHRRWTGEGRVDEPGTAWSMVTGITGLAPNDDVGVSAVVKSIHALDGVINSWAWGKMPYSVLNVHDAQVSPWWAATDVARYANNAFGTVLNGYDLPKQYSDMLDRSITSLLSRTSDKLTTQQKEAIGVAFFEYAVEFKPAGLDWEAMAIQVETGTMPPAAAGFALIKQLQDMLAADVAESAGGKQSLFGDIRAINQFAQQNTSAIADNGIELGSDNWVSIEGSTIQNLLPENVVTDTAISLDTEAQFAEDFGTMFESAKVQEAWEAMSEMDEDIDTQHQNHLRNVMRDLVVPGFENMTPILEMVAEEQGRENVAWEGEINRLNKAAHKLHSNSDITLQESAAQEYLSAVVEYSLNGKEEMGLKPDHFVRKEARRLFELAKEGLTPAMLEDPKVGDGVLRRTLAQERFDYIFNGENANEAYQRFLSVGLTNKPLYNALASLDNQDEVFSVKWDNGILRGMLSVVRQMVQRLSGVSVRHNGGSISDAMTALAKTAIAMNQRNQQRLQDLKNGTDTTSRVQRLNNRIVAAAHNRFVAPLQAGLNTVERKRLDSQDPNLKDFLKSATYVALRSRDDDVRAHYNKFYRELTTPYGVGKDNAFFQTIAEVTPWDEGSYDWMDLLRKSKHMVDSARQEAHDHTRTFINSSFDKSKHLTKAVKMSMTRAILRTDLASLTRGDQELSLDDIVKLLEDPQAVTNETSRLESMLRQALNAEGQPGLYNLFRNQALSLGNFMVTGETTVANGMLNAHNITNQYMTAAAKRVALKDRDKVMNLVDRLASIYAVSNTSIEDRVNAGEVARYEMEREDAAGDNGMSRLIGMHINFQELAREKLFDNQPAQMIKGYVYEIFDGDVNIEYVEEGSEREQELLAEGMVLVGELPKDKRLDSFQQRRLLYKGMRGLNTYNKSIVSLTDMQHRGANLFSTMGYQSRASRINMTAARTAAFKEVSASQYTAHYQETGTHMVPVLNNQGEIVDYRYMMNEANKQRILKKEDPFDRVLPRMFASITDRNNTKSVNQDVVKLLRDEYRALRNNKAHRFIEIGLGSDKEGREMWNLLPEDMQRELEKAFGFKGFYVRDDVLNLVLGFRKMTVSNLKGPDGEGTLWGQGTPVVRMAEKVWQEVVSLMRIKIAILTPAVVVGNIASNTAMLLSEGIPVNYIRRNASEAISGMRQYQKDRKAASELSHRIGAARALGRNTRNLETKLGRLEADLAANPVGQLVEEGLFTSITADLGVDDDTIRGSLIQKAEDALGNKGGKLGKGAAHLAKEAYMLPGSKGYQAAVAATQYGDFVARYIKFKYDTQVNKMDTRSAINSALAAFIYYDIPQPRYLQALNDNGLVMFTKFFLRIQPIVARMYTQNPVSAFAVLGLQRGLLPTPFNENIMNYGLGDGLTQKPTAPWNIPGKAYDTLDPTEPALLQWLLNPFGL